MSTRNFQNNNRITEWTDELVNIPNRWGMINQMGLFVPKSIAQLAYTFDETTYGTTLLVDSPRGERSVYGKDHNRKTHTVSVPHFTYDDKIGPEDLQGVRADGSADSATTLAQARADVLERTRRNYMATFEYARAQALQGIVYSPNDTVSINWYTEFGITRKQVDFDLGTATTDVIEKSEEVISHIQDNLLSGEMVGEIVALCSPEFFAKLIKQDLTRDAYLYYTAQNNGARQPLRDRLGSPMDVRARQFEHGGVTFIEYRGSFTDKDGNVLQMIPANEAYAFPVDVTDMFRTIYAPAHRLSTSNTLGREMYAYEEIIQDKAWEYETESNFLNMVTRPNAIVRLYTAPETAD